MSSTTTATSDPLESPAKAEPQDRNYTDEDFLDYFAQAGVQKPALESLKDFQAFFPAFFGTELAMTLTDRHRFLSLYINAKKARPSTPSSTSSPSSNSTATQANPATKPPPVDENLKITSDSFAEWNDSQGRVKGTLHNYLNATTPSPSPKTGTPRKQQGDADLPAIPPLEKLMQIIRSLNHNSTRGKHRSAFYSEEDVMFLRTQRGNKSDTDYMRKIGASFDWALKLWWVPEGTQLSKDYDKYLLGNEENAAFNALHQQVMQTLTEEEEE